MLRVFVCWVRLSPLKIFRPIPPATPDPPDLKHEFLQRAPAAIRKLEAFLPQAGDRKRLGGRFLHQTRVGRGRSGCRCKDSGMSRVVVSRDPLIMAVVMGTTLCRGRWKPSSRRHQILPLQPAEHSWMRCVSPTVNVHHERK